MRLLENIVFTLLTGQMHAFVWHTLKGEGKEYTDGSCFINAVIKSTLVTSQPVQQWNADWVAGDSFAGRGSETFLGV
jgi:hypothetical protein